MATTEVLVEAEAPETLEVERSESSEKPQREKKRREFKDEDLVAPEKVDKPDENAMKRQTEDLDSEIKALRSRLVSQGLLLPPFQLNIEY